MDRKIARAAFLAGFLVAPSVILAGAGLDGTEWTVSSKNNPGKPDTLAFENGKFTSSQSHASGFQASSYESEARPDQITWTTTQVNTKGETMEWSGARKDDDMTGLYTFTSVDGETVSLHWTAKKSK